MLSQKSFFKLQTLAYIPLHSTTLPPLYTN